MGNLVWGETIDEDADADDISCRLFYSSCTATIPAPEDAGRWRCCYWLQQTNTASHRKQPLKDGVEIWLLLRIFMWIFSWPPPSIPGQCCPIFLRYDIRTDILFGSHKLNIDFSHRIDVLTCCNKYLWSCRKPFGKQHLNTRRSYEITGNINEQISQLWWIPELLKIGLV